MRALVLFHVDDRSILGMEAVNAVTSTLERAGHEIDVVDLAGSGFDPVMTADERRAYHTDEPITDARTRTYADLVGRAGLIVFIYHSRLTTVPAAIKGWLEKVLVPGVAFRFDERGKVRPALGQVQRIIGVVTYDDGWFAVKRRRDAGRRTITRALRLNTGWRTRTQWIGLYRAAGASAEQRAAFLARIDHQLERS